MKQLYRRILCQKMVALLEQAKIVPEKRVFNQYGIRVPQERLPCLYVSAPMDHAVAKTVGTPFYERTATLVLQLFLGFVNTEQGQQDLDRCCYQIEQAFSCDVGFQGLVQSIPSFRTQVLYHTETAVQIAEARYELDCLYYENFFPEGEVLREIDGVLTASTTPHGS